MTGHTLCFYQEGFVFLEIFCPPGLFFPRARKPVRGANWQGNAKAFPVRIKLF